jgi:hypothetical protein
MRRQIQEADKRRRMKTAHKMRDAEGEEEEYQ